MTTSGKAKRQEDLKKMSLWLYHRKSWDSVLITGKMAGFIADALEKLGNIEKSVKRK